MNGPTLLDRLNFRQAAAARRVKARDTDICYTSRRSTPGGLSRPERAKRCGSAQAGTRARRHLQSSSRGIRNSRCPCGWIGIEACAGAHHIARQVAALGAQSVLLATKNWPRRVLASGDIFGGGEGQIGDLRVLRAGVKFTG